MPAVALAYPPDRRSILVNFGSHRRHARSGGMRQEDVRALRHAFERVTIAHEAFEFSDILLLRTLSLFGCHAYNCFAVDPGALPHNQQPLECATGHLRPK